MTGRRDAVPTRTRLPTETELERAFAEAFDRDTTRPYRMTPEQQAALLELARRA